VRGEGVTPENVVLLVLLLVPLICAQVCWLKGKFWYALGFLLPPAGVFSVVGAVRLAKPGAIWARFYGREKMDEANRRFPDDAVEVSPD
jgi:hypothetical protein